MSENDENVGYESHGSKRALVAGTRGKRFDLIDGDTGKFVHHGSLSAAGAVKGWGNTRYLVADFTGFHKTGQYMVKVEQQTSTPFQTEDDLLEPRTASDVIHYFKGSRCTGQFDKRDAAIPTKDHPHARHDVRGGWYDATKDFGEHHWLHRTVWMLFTFYDQLTTRHNANFTQLRMPRKPGQHWKTRNWPATSAPSPTLSLRPPNSSAPPVNSRTGRRQPR